MAVKETTRRHTSADVADAGVKTKNNESQKMDRAEIEQLNALSSILSTRVRRKSNQQAKRRSLSSIDFDWKSSSSSLNTSSHSAGSSDGDNGVSNKEILNRSLHAYDKDFKGTLRQNLNKAESARQLMVEKSSLSLSSSFDKNEKRRSLTKTGATSPSRRDVPPLFPPPKGKPPKPVSSKPNDNHSAPNGDRLRSDSKNLQSKRALLKVAKHRAKSTRALVSEPGIPTESETPKKGASHRSVNSFNFGSLQSEIERVMEEDSRRALDELRRASQSQQVFTTSTTKNKTTQNHAPKRKFMLISRKFMPVEKIMYGVKEILKRLGREMDDIESEIKIIQRDSEYNEKKHERLLKLATEQHRRNQKRVLVGKELVKHHQLRQLGIDDDILIDHLREENVHLRSRLKLAGTDVYNIETNIIRMNKTNEQSEDAIQDAKQSYVDNVSKKLKFQYLLEKAEVEYQAELNHINGRKQARSREHRDQDEYRTKVMKIIQMLDERCEDRDLVYEVKDFAEAYLPTAWDENLQLFGNINFSDTDDSDSDVDISDDDAASFAGSDVSISLSSSSVSS